MGLEEKELPPASRDEDAVELPSACKWRCINATSTRSKHNEMGGERADITACSGSKCITCLLRRCRHIVRRSGGDAVADAEADAGIALDARAHASLGLRCRAAAASIPETRPAVQSAAEQIAAATAAVLVVGDRAPSLTPSRHSQRQESALEMNGVATATALSPVPGSRTASLRGAVLPKLRHVRCPTSIFSAALTGAPQHQTDTLPQLKSVQPNKTSGIMRSAQIYAKRWGNRST